MTFSQSKKSDFIAAEIVKSDNTKIDVLINKIYFPQNDSFLGMESEKNNKKIRKKFFEYKIDENDEPLKIYLSDIKKIILKDKYNGDITKKVAHKKNRISQKEILFFQYLFDNSLQHPVDKVFLRSMVIC